MLSPETGRGSPTTESALYVYGITRSGVSAPALSGVLGGAVEVVSSGDVAALVTPVASPKVRAKRRDLLAHSDVVQAAHAGGVVLPLRFGTLFDSEPELRHELLESRGAELRKLLDRFDGLCELRVRGRYHDQETVLSAVVAANPDIAAHSERLRGRASQAELMQLGERIAASVAAQRARDADAILARLASLSVDVVAEEPVEELEIVRASFLLRQGDVRKFDEQLASNALGLRHLASVTAIGPMPAHSFVAIEGGL